MPIAKYDLQEVHRLVRANNVAFIAPSRSTDLVAIVFPQKEIVEIEKYMLDGLLSLTQIDWAQSFYYSEWKCVLDIYGKKIDGVNWYIKFLIEDDGTGGDGLSEVSFHPLEEDLKLASGVILKKEEL